MGGCGDAAGDSASGSAGSGSAGREDESGGSGADAGGEGSAGGGGGGGGAESAEYVSCSALSILALLTAFPPLTMEIYIPSLPTIQSEFHTTAARVLSTLSVYTAPSLSRVSPKSHLCSPPRPPSRSGPSRRLQRGHRARRKSLTLQHSTGRSPSGACSWCSASSPTCMAGGASSSSRWSAIAAPASRAPSRPASRPCEHSVRGQDEG